MRSYNQRLSCHFCETEGFFLSLNHELCNAQLDTRRKEKNKIKDMILTNKEAQYNWLPTAHRQGEKMTRNVFKA